MHYFYSERIEGERAWLDEEESRHCTRTLRKQPGDVLQVMDGKGNLYEAELSSIEKRGAWLRLLRVYPPEPVRSYGLHLGIAPTKNAERIEWLVEKAVEIGIDRITLLRCRHSERRELRCDRLRKIALSAAKQSLQLTLPVIDEMTDFEDFIRQNNRHPAAFIAHCRSAELPPLARLCPPGCSALVLIGPEGDFSEAEIELALHSGFQAVGLGKSRLRTETAGLAVCLQLYLSNPS